MKAFMRGLELVCPDCGRYLMQISSVPPAEFDPRHFVLRHPPTEECPNSGKSYALPSIDLQQV